MKKILLLLCFTLFAVSASAEDTITGEEISFTATEHNFGKIPERGKAVSCIFEFTNTGKRPIVITRMATTCKCTSYDFSKRPVAPGQKGQITITYNPRKQTGVFYKVVQVFTNCAQERVMLTVRGEVVEKK